MNGAALAEENARLKALLAQTQAALADSEEARRRLEAILTDLRREKFGAKSEKLSPDQFSLALEDVELAQGVLDAAQEKAAATLAGKPPGAAPAPRRNRGHLPAHLPRVERVIEPASTLCPCGCGEMAKIGEDVSERLDVVPGAVAGAGDAPPEIRLPPLLGGGGAGACAGACRAGRAADRGADRRGHRREVRRPSAVLPPGRDLRPPGHPARPGDLGQLGRPGLLPPPADRRAHAQAPRRGRSPVHGRDHRAGARSRARADQEGLLLGDRLGRPRPRRPQLRRSCCSATRRGAAASMPSGSSQGFRGRFLQCDGYDGYERLDRRRAAGGAVDAGALLEPPAAALRQADAQHQIPDRRGRRPADRHALRHRGARPRHGAGGAARRPAGAVGAASSPR